MVRRTVQQPLPPPPRLLVTVHHCLGMNGTFLLSGNSSHTDLTADWSVIDLEVFVLKWQRKKKGSPHKRREMLAERRSWRCVSRYRRYESATHLRTGLMGVLLPRPAPKMKCAPVTITSSNQSNKPRLSRLLADGTGPLAEWHAGKQIDSEGT